MTSAAPTTKAPSSGIAYVHLDFVLTGIVMTLLGPILPILSAKWSLDDAQAGHLFTAQFISSMFGMLLSGLSARRFGYRRTLIYGLVGMAAGIALLAHASWIGGMIAVSIFGAGFGLTTPSANLLIARTYAESSAAALSLLNSSWGVGALFCPILLAAAERSHHTPVFLNATAFALAALAIRIAGLRFAADSETHTKTVSSAGTVHRVSSGSLVLLIACLFFVYVGTETCMGGWIASYARRIDTGSRSFWAVTPSFFWGALLFGRTTAPFVLKRVRPIDLARVGVSLAAFGIGVLLATKIMVFVLLGTTIAGLGLASIYPINVSLLSQWFGKMSPRLSGVIFSLGTLGGAALPWMVGVISTRSGSLRLGFVVPLSGTLMMLSFYLLQRDSVRASALVERA